MNNFIYKHECESTSNGNFEEDFYINKKEAFTSNALLNLQIFLESKWQNYKCNKQAEQSCCFIVFIHSGTQKRVTENGEYLLTAGDLMIERVSQKLLYSQSYGNEILHRTGIILYRNVFFDTIAGTLFPETSNIIHCCNPEKIINCLKDIKTQILSNNTKAEVISQLLFGLLQEAYFQKNNNQLPSKLDKALKYIEKNGFAPISREELAQASGVSVRLLTLLFNKHLNISPGKYLSNRRIKYACELLSAGQLSVGEIAQLAGFNSIEYFIREFKRCTGSTPGKFEPK